MQRTPAGRHAARRRQPSRVGPKAAVSATKIRWAGVIGVVSATAGVSLALGLGGSPLPTHQTADVPLDGTTVLSQAGVAQAKYNHPAPEYTTTGAEPAVTWFLGGTPTHRHSHRQPSGKPAGSWSASPQPSGAGSSVTDPPDSRPPAPQPSYTQPAQQPTPTWTPSADPTPSTDPTPSADPTPSSAASDPTAPTPTAEYQTPKGDNQLAWSEAILTALGAPITDANVTSLGYWMQNEAGSPPSGIVGANNPINVSQTGYDGTPIKSEGCCYSLMSYPTVQDGVEATVAYLERSSYTLIVADLKAGSGLSSGSLAQELSTYSGNGYTTIPDNWGASQGAPELPPS